MGFYTDWYLRTVERMRQKSASNVEMKLKAALDVLRDADHIHAQLEQAFAARFYRKVMPSEDCPEVTPMLIPCTERTVSDAFDLSDLYDEIAQFLYLDDDGTLYPVTAGAMTRNDYEDQPNIVSVYGSSDLIANDKVVGTVFYTDH